MSKAPIEVCCIYASADEALREALEKHVSVLKHQGLISLWLDRQMTAGQNRIQVMDAHLSSAAVILLLISPDFLASEACYEMALQRALQRHHRGETQVVPILVRPIHWQGTPFAHLTALPTGAKPITLWDNQDAAWVDVANGLRLLVEAGTLPPQARLPQVEYAPICNLPFPRNPFFTGRDDVLAKLEHILQQAPCAALSGPQAVSGLGGIGKTQIALEYAYQHRDHYQAVVWCRAQTREDLIAGYVALASLLQLATKDEKDQLVVVQAVITWLSTHEHWLLILDNADSLSIVQEFLPTVARGHVLLTTRAASMGRLAQCLEIESFSPDAGAVFVLRRAGRLAIDAPLQQAAAHDVEVARQLVEHMGGLPLALDQAGAYMEEARCSPSSYLSLYQSERTALFKERGGIVQDHPATVATTWSLSFTKVEQASSIAADLLRVCAFLQPDAIPEEIFVEGASQLGNHLQVLSNDPLAFNAAIKVLRSYSLVRRDPDGHLLSVHRLVQAVLKDSMDEAAWRQWSERVVSALDTVLPDDVEYPTWKRYERCLVHALGCVPLINDLHLISPAARRLLRVVGIYLRERAQYSEAEALLARGLALDEQHVGAEHLDTAASQYHLAELYRLQGKDERAELLYEQALSVRKRLLGAEHPDTARNMNNLAVLYWQQGKSSLAEPLFQRTLSIFEQTLGPQHPVTARCLHGLANLYMQQHKYSEAEPLYQRALSIWKQHLGAHHPFIAASQNNLAELYRQQGKYGQAEPLLEQALSFLEQHLGADHPDTARSLNNLALLSMQQNKYEQAKPLYRRALSIYEKQLVADHLDTAEALYGLAKVCQHQGEYTEAESIFQRALAIYEQKLGPTHPLTQNTRRDYLAFLRLVGRDAEATALEETDHDPGAPTHH